MLMYNWYSPVMSENRHAILWSGHAINGHKCDQLVMCCHCMLFSQPLGQLTYLFKWTNTSVSFHAFMRHAVFTAFWGHSVWYIYISHKLKYIIWCSGHTHSHDNYRHVYILLQSFILSRYLALESLEILIKSYFIVDAAILLYTHTHMHARAHARAHTHTQTHTHKHTQTHIHKHTQKHTHIQHTTQHTHNNIHAAT